MKHKATGLITPSAVADRSVKCGAPRMGHMGDTAGVPHGPGRAEPFEELSDCPAVSGTVALEAQTVELVLSYLRSGCTWPRVPHGGGVPPPLAGAARTQPSR